MQPGGPAVRDYISFSSINLVAALAPPDSRELQPASQESCRRLGRGQAGGRLSWERPPRCLEDRAVGCPLPPTPGRKPTPLPRSQVLTEPLGTAEKYSLNSLGRLLRPHSRRGQPYALASCWLSSCFLRIHSEPGAVLSVVLS